MATFDQTNKSPKKTAADELSLRLHSSNPYTLLPAQVEILLKWLLLVL